MYALILRLQFNQSETTVLLSHDIAEILLKVTLSTKNQSFILSRHYWDTCYYRINYIFVILVWMDIMVRYLSQK
jgi:VanZ family protein